MLGGDAAAAGFEELQGMVEEELLAAGQEELHELVGATSTAPQAYLLDA